ncbi:MAG: hypothetical protein JNL21_37155 [Myxococcales bacterium]|nr:hypothetical protein [Myxococcales bacterium]
MTSRRAWLLNLDAEEELFRGSSYGSPLRAVSERPDLVSRLGGLVPEGDIVLGSPRDRADGCRGLAWAPTPRARDALVRSGASAPGAPAAATLQRAMSRRFCDEVGLTLPGALLTTNAGAALGRLQEPTPSGRWLLRRSWGFAGRGRLVAEAGAPVRDNARGFVERAVADGGVLVEPWVERRGDFSLHGWLGDDGALVRGEVCESSVNRGGAWQRSARAHMDALSATERQALATSLAETARALASLGYFGPFGVDAFRYAWGAETRFNPRCDVNPRYSMGWAVGMGDRRPDLER